MGMMLYAIQDQETGSWITYIDGTVYFRYMPDSCFSNYYEAANVLKKVEDLLDQKTFKIVTFRELPAESCEWCNDGIIGGEMFRLTHETTANAKAIQCDRILKHTLESCAWELCPHCGRVLK